MTQTIQQQTLTREYVMPVLPIDLDPTQGWPAQGEWTYEDYLRLPDDGNRYEVIYGVLYVQAAPLVDHQYTVTVLLAIVASYVFANQRGMVLSAPTEVHLQSHARPIMPDLLFVSSANLPAVGAKAIYEPPEWVVEVLSPSTRRRDVSVKLDAYEQGGVGECWIVDPEAHNVTVYARAAEGEGFVIVGVFGRNDTVESPLFPDLVVSVRALFRE